MRKKMKPKDFEKHIPVLEERPFELYPAPKGLDMNKNKFQYADYTDTHVTLVSTATSKIYCLPLSVVDFANPGILRLSREMTVRNGGFI